MSFRLSNHAKRELQRRNIDLADVEAIMETPDQITEELDGIVCYQSKAISNGKTHLLRVMVNEVVEPVVVVTVYKTSKISKYWKP